MSPSASSSAPLVLLLALCLVASTAFAHDITKILEQHEEYSRLNEILSDSGIAKEINSKGSVTVLALNNHQFDLLADKTPEELADILKVHVAVDYYDEVKLSHMKMGTPQEMVNLYQSSGVSQYGQGLLKVNRTADGIFFKSSGRRSSPFDSKFVSQVYARRFNISVISISHPIYVSGMTDKLAPPLPPPAPKAKLPPPPAESPEEVVADAPSEEEAQAPAPDADSPSDAPAESPNMAADEDDASDNTPQHHHTNSSAGKQAIASTFGLALVAIAAIVANF